MPEINGARVADKIEERLVIKGRDFFEIHQVRKLSRGRLNNQRLLNFASNDKARLLIRD